MCKKNNQTEFGVVLDLEKITICEKCRKNITDDKADCCVCGEVDCCEDCIKECYDCDQNVCNSCTEMCDCCGNNTICNSCYNEKTCTECNNSCCSDCSYTCEGCENVVCSDCSNSCSGCETIHCSNCLNTCTDCGESFCGDCNIYSCGHCGDTICEDCSRYCSCDEISCERCSDGCYIDNEEIDLDDYSYDPKILPYEAKPDSWKFVKQQWENTIFLGIELEMGFSSSNEAEILAISGNYLKGKHIWKEDSSISGNGGELVITPHTLQAFRKVNLYKMLKEFSKIGARSYDNETCGLHIHVNRENFRKHPKLLNKVRDFFVTNKASLIRFSQRTEEELNKWCSIPENYGVWNGDKYEAIHPTSETIEFRFFRGTLNYDRFKASLQFAEAIIMFAIAHSQMSCKNNNSWSHFIKFLRNRPEYTKLFTYLTKKGIV